MTPDWKSGTCARGQNALACGRAVEELVFRTMTEAGHKCEWISNDSDKWLLGHDMIIDGKRVEIKSNEYVSESGSVVIEISDKTSFKSRSKWMGGAADILLFVARSTGQFAMYDARRLTDHLDSIPRHRIRSYNGADCLHVQLRNPALIAEGNMS